MEIVIGWKNENGERDGYIAVGETIIPIGYENARKLIYHICKGVKLELIDENPHEQIYATRDNKIELRIFSSTLMDAEILSISL